MFESAWSLVVCSAVLAFPPPPRSARSLSAPRCLAAHPAALKPVCLAAVPTQRSFCHSWQGPCPRACPAPLRARDRMLLLSTCPERVRSVFWFWQRCTISRCSALAASGAATTCLWLNVPCAGTVVVVVVVTCSLACVVIAFVRLSFSPCFHCFLALPQVKAPRRRAAAHGRRRKEAV